MRKIHSNSTFKRLSPERQQEIAQYAATHSQAETAKWLTDNGLPVSQSQLSRFLAWYRLQSSAFREPHMAEIKPENSAAALSHLSNDELELLLFTMLAIERKSVEDWARVQDIRLRREALDLARETLRLLEPPPQFSNLN